MEKMYIAADKVAEALEVPEEVFKWTLEKYRKQDALTEGKDYIMSQDKMCFTLSGLLWAVARCNGNFRGAVALAEKLSTNKETENALVAYNNLRQKLPEISEAMTIAQETVSEALARAQESIDEAVALAQETVNEALGVENPVPPVKVLFHKRNSSALPPLNEAQKKWSAEVTELVNRKARESGKMAVHIQKHIYTVMNRKYGVVWEQERIDTLKRFGLEKEPMTTFRCICYNDKLQSLYKSILEDYK